LICSGITAAIRRFWLAGAGENDDSKAGLGTDPRPLDSAGAARQSAAMITPRDMVVALISALFVMLGVTMAESNGDAVMHSSAFNWADLKVTPMNGGEMRAVFNTPTATMAALECHITTINPGVSPHPPHRHPEEEMLLIKEGTVGGGAGRKDDHRAAGRSDLRRVERTA
jgi:hypothetical protein